MNRGPLLLFILKSLARILQSPPIQTYAPKLKIRVKTVSESANRRIEIISSTNRRLVIRVPYLIFLIFRVCAAKVQDAVTKHCLRRF
jgi:hypothetical protein